MYIKNEMILLLLRQLEIFLSHLFSSLYMGKGIIPEDDDLLTMWEEIRIRSLFHVEG